MPSSARLMCCARPSVSQDAAAGLLGPSFRSEALQGTAALSAGVIPSGHGAHRSLLHAILDLATAAGAGAGDSRAGDEGEPGLGVSAAPAQLGGMYGGERPYVRLPLLARALDGLLQLHVAAHSCCRAGRASAGGASAEAGRAGAPHPPAAEGPSVPEGAPEGSEAHADTSAVPAAGQRPEAPAASPTQDHLPPAAAQAIAAFEVHALAEDAVAAGAAVSAEGSAGEPPLADAAEVSQDAAEEGEGTGSAPLEGSPTSDPAVLSASASTTDSSSSPSSVSRRRRRRRGASACSRAAIFRQLPPALDWLSDVVAALGAACDVYAVAGPAQEQEEGPEALLDGPEPRPADQLAGGWEPSSPGSPADATPAGSPGEPSQPSSYASSSSSASSAARLAVEEPPGTPTRSQPSRAPSPEGDSAFAVPTLPNGGPGLQPDLAGPAKPDASIPGSALDAASGAAPAGGVASGLGEWCLAGERGCSGRGVLLEALVRALQCPCVVAALLAEADSDGGRAGAALCERPVWRHPRLAGFAPAAAYQKQVPAMRGVAWACVSGHPHAVSRRHLRGALEPAAAPCVAYVSSGAGATAGAAELRVRGGRPGCAAAGHQPRRPAGHQHCGADAGGSRAGRQRGSARARQLRAGRMTGSAVSCLAQYDAYSLGGEGISIAFDEEAAFGDGG
jgi:hypothetical protein